MLSSPGLPPPLKLRRAIACKPRRSLGVAGTGRSSTTRPIHVIARSEATKQSILSSRGEMDCFASLAMTADRYDFTISRHDAPGVLHFVGPLEVKRAQGRPGARRTRGLARKTVHQTRAR